MTDKINNHERILEEKLQQLTAEIKKSESELKEIEDLVEGREEWLMEMGRIAENAGKIIVQKRETNRFKEETKRFKEETKAMELKSQEWEEEIKAMELKSQEKRERFEKFMATDFDSSSIKDGFKNGLKAVGAISIAIIGLVIMF